MANELLFQLELGNLLVNECVHESCEVDQEIPPLFLVERHLLQNHGIADSRGEPIHNEVENFLGIVLENVESGLNHLQA